MKTSKSIKITKSNLYLSLVTLCLMVEAGQGLDFAGVSTPSEAFEIFEIIKLVTGRPTPGLKFTFQPGLKALVEEFQLLVKVLESTGGSFVDFTMQILENQLRKSPVVKMQSRMALRSVGIGISVGLSLERSIDNYFALKYAGEYTYKLGATVKDLQKDLKDKSLTLPFSVLGLLQESGAHLHRYFLLVAGSEQF